MSDPADARLALAHCDAALEASCDALIVLQVIDALAINLSDVRNAVRVAIEATSRAISELRRARTVRGNPITVGFVLAGNERGAGSNSPPEG